MNGLLLLNDKNGSLQTTFSNNHTLYLEIHVDGIKLTPRKRLTSLPYSFNTQYLMGITAPSFGNIAVTTFESEKNPFEKTPIKEEKEKIIQKQITAPLEKLAGTPAEKYIKVALGKVGQLEKFYNRDKINKVAEYMGKALR